MTGNDSQLLDLICANYERRMVAAERGLPASAARRLAKLRRQGLVLEFALVPAGKAFAAWTERHQVPETPPPLKGRQTRPSWTAERKAALIAAIRETGEVRKALVKLGLSPSSKAGPYAERRSDPEFRRQWDEALASSQRPRGGDVKRRAAEANNRQSQASGTKETTRSDAKRAQGVRPDSPSCPEHDGAYGSAAGASEIVRKEAAASAGSTATAVRPAAARTDGGTPKPNWLQNYAERLERAKAFLRGKSYAITPVSRDAAIASWWVSGYQGQFRNEQLVELAIARGLELPA